MRIYLDNCCYNRPFDDQGQLKVRLETEAKMEVQDLMRTGVVEYVWSGMLEAEVGDSPYVDRQEKIFPWGDSPNAYVAVDGEIESAAEEYAAMGLKTADAIHVACAVAANCDWFLTVDRGILNKISQIGPMRVGTPIDYVEEVLG